MPSFPTSVKAFVSKAAGNTIQPADVNDLQDEVTALETGYLNGSAPLNSSNSTVAHLSVTGTSTFVGAVSFTAGFANLSVAGGSTLATLSAGASTFTGAVTFSTSVIGDAQPRARLFHSSTQSLPNTTETAVTFDSEEFDPQGLHSTASSPTRITCGSTGVWLFGGNVNFATTSQSLYLRFRKNGATNIGSKVQFGGNGANNHAMQLQAQAIDVISATTDYVELIAWQNAGVALQLGNASSRVDQNDFWAVKLW